MKTAALIREQIEDSLSARILMALSPREREKPRKTPCGIAAIDELLGGGLPAGALTELVGQNGAGRTTVALAYMAAVTRTEAVCAWIDVADALDPETVAANGVDLEKLLWVRCGAEKASPLKAASGPPQNGSSLMGIAVSEARHTGGGSPHPRSEGRDMPKAIGAMLHAHGGLYDRQARREKKSIGTPGAPNRPLAYRSEHREEQVNSDRLPPRRGDNLAIAARCAEPQPRRIASQSTNEHLSIVSPLSGEAFSNRTSSWNALDQALRAADLLLQSGGFSAIVLDLGSVQPELAWRIPLATWFRFRAACERTRMSLVLLTQHPCARSSAEIVVRLQPGSMEAQNRVMTGVRYRAETERNRSHGNEGHVIPIRKPPQSERLMEKQPGQWTSDAAWVRAK